jgi:hypothetical protein
MPRAEDAGYRHNSQSELKSKGRLQSSNENKMSDGGRGRALIEVKM